MEIFWRLFLAHLIADFTLQTDTVNRLKRKGLPGMCLHVGTHVFISVVLIYNFLFQNWYKIFGIELNGWFILFVMSVIHFFIDELRIYLINKVGLPDNTWNFLADQFAHFYFIFVLSPINSFKSEIFIEEKWVIIVSCLVIISHVATIFIYFVEQDLNKIKFPSFDQKYFMIVERIIMWAFFLTPGYWWIPFFILWVFQLIYIKARRIIDVSNTNIYISIIFSIIFGLISRFFYYGKI